MPDTTKDSFFPGSEEPEIKIPEFLQSSNVNSAAINTLEAQVKTWGAGASKDKTCNDQHPRKHRCDIHNGNHRSSDTHGCIVLFVLNRVSAFMRRNADRRNTSSSQYISRKIQCFVFGIIIIT